MRSIYHEKAAIDKMGSADTDCNRSIHREKEGAITPLPIEFHVLPCFAPVPSMITSVWGLAPFEFHAKYERAGKGYLNFNGVLVVCPVKLCQSF